MNIPFFKQKPKSVLTPDLYESIYSDIRFWCANELTANPPAVVDGKQTNALLNFIVFDLTTLMTEEGFAHMRMLLIADHTQQTVMIRLKGLVMDLYIKYGDTIIDELRQRVYQSMRNLYGLTFDIENYLDVNNTLWLHPFIRKMYSELQAH